MLEECGLPYRVHAVDIAQGDQFEPAFLSISPNNRMPAIVDHQPMGGGSEPLAIFESGAILLYLAEKSGKFLPTDTAGRYDVIQWVMWQMGGLGPMLGQHGHFKLYAPEKVPYALNRYREEALRLYGVLDRRLASREYICDDYSIADMMCWPWVITYKSQQLDLDEFPNLRRWYDALKSREGLRRGYEVGRDRGKTISDGPDEKAREILFGAKPEGKEA